MTHVEAMEHVEKMMLAVQKFRSNIKDDSTMFEMNEVIAAHVGYDAVERIHADMFPWCLDEQKCVLPVLVDVVMGKRQLEPMGFFNLMSVATRREPVIRLICGLYQQHELPEPDIEWLRGWDA